MLLIEEIELVDGAEGFGAENIFAGGNGSDDKFYPKRFDSLVVVVGVLCAQVGWQVVV